MSMKIRIKAFKGKFEQFQKVGLQKKEDMLKNMTAQNRSHYEDLFKVAIDNGNPDLIWDPDRVHTWIKKMEKLNTDLDEAEIET